MFISIFFRNAYTSRILEIIGNIKKQKISIDKILNDTRELQKEINTINGQLDRQFTVTDDLLFKVGKKPKFSLFLKINDTQFPDSFRRPKKTNNRKKPTSYWLHYTRIAVI